MADMKTLGGQNGAEGLAAFHTALIADFLGQPEARNRLPEGVADQPRQPPRDRGLWPFPGARRPRRQDAKALYEKFADDGGVAPVAKSGLARIATNKKPVPFIRSAEDGAAEGLFGIAASLTDAASADISILYLRMALYLQPDLALANILLADRFESLGKYDDAMAIYRQVDKSSPYYRMAAVQAAIDETRLDRKTTAPSPISRRWPRPIPTMPRTGSRWATPIATRRITTAAIEAYDHAEKAIGTPDKKRLAAVLCPRHGRRSRQALGQGGSRYQMALKLSPDQPELLNYLGYSWVDHDQHIARGAGHAGKGAVAAAL